LKKTKKKMGEKSGIKNGRLCRGFKGPLSNAKGLGHASPRPATREKEKKKQGRGKGSGTLCVVRETGSKISLLRGPISGGEALPAKRLSNAQAAGPKEGRKGGKKKTRQDKKRREMTRRETGP